MEQFIVSARKYRPAEFRTVVGQDSITKTLQNAIKTNQVAQAFLFCGPRGVGKTTCARILAKALNCKNLTPEGEPCNDCESCHSFDKNASMNIYELDAASNSSVEKMRELVDQVRIPPQGGKYKVYIIDEVHMLSTNAFNAFLKTLEEPPAYAKFILATTEKHKIIPTILSRCQIFDFRRITIEDIALHLRFVANSEGVTADDEALHMIALKADGGLRDALSLFDQMVSFSGKTLSYHDVIANLNILDYDYFFRIVDFVVACDIKETMLLLDEIIDRGFDPQHFILGLSSHIRNLIMAQTESTVRLIEVSEQIKQKYINQAKITSTQLFIKMLDIANKCDAQYRESNNKRLTVELALLQMCQWHNPQNNSGNKSDIYTKPSAVNQNQVNSPENLPKTTAEISTATITTPKYEISSTTSNSKDDFANSDAKQSSYLSNKNLQGEMISIKKAIRTISTSLDTSVVSEQEASFGTKEVSTSDVMEKWTTIVDEQMSNSPFASQVRDFKIDFSFESQILKVTFTSQLVKQTLIEFLPNIQKRMREELTLNGLRIELIEGEKDAEEVKVAYTDEEKFKEIMQANPEIYNFKKTLGLDIYR